MAQYRIDYQCGHSIVEQLYGKTDGRYEHIERQKSRLCPDCYRAQQTEQAADHAEAAGLPKLTGSDKQIAWAETIRSKKLAEIAQQRADFEALGLRKGATPENIAAGMAQFDAVAAKVTVQADARFWIDNRDLGAISLMRAVR